MPGAFQNAPPSPPLFRRTSYKVLMFVLSAIALGFFALNVTAAVFMILAVFLSVGGTYSTMQASRTTGSAVGLISKTFLGTQGVGLVVYLIAFAVVVSSAGSGGDDEESFTTFPG